MWVGGQGSWLRWASQFPQLELARVSFTSPRGASMQAVMGTAPPPDHSFFLLMSTCESEASSSYSRCRHVGVTSSSSRGPAGLRVVGGAGVVGGALTI